jgi:hypothetical protein
MSDSSQTTAARLGIEKAQLELTQHLMSEDPLPLVLRGHMHIQAALTNFVRARGLLQNQIPSKYSHLVQRAVILGLPNEFSKQLVFIGHLRNRFSHDLKAKISKADADAFAAAYELGDDVIEYAYQNTLSKMNDTTNKRSVHDLEPKERVILHIITLWAGIAVATAKAKGLGTKEGE